VNQNWLVTAFFFALLLVLLYGALLILSPFLKALVWAAILAVLFYPGYAWLLERLGGRASVAALIVVVLITLVVVLPGIRLAGYLVNEAVDLVKSLASGMTEEGAEVWKQDSWVRTILGWWSFLGMELAGLDLKVDWKDIVVQGAKTSSAALVSQVTGVAQNLLLFVANFVVVLISLFFFLRDGAEFCYRLRRLLPMDQEHQERLFVNIVNATTAVVHGCFVVAIIQGLLAGIAYWLLGVPYAVVWGVLTAFVALLPVGGTTLVSVPVTIYLFLQGETVRAIILLIWCVGVVGTVDNILKPMFIGSRLQLPLIFLFFGILGGLAVFGALGLILGPVLFALLAALLDLYSQEYGAGNERSRS
jgi:predicted PurR-regulated permease PerM